ncbi:MAG TPA: endonuclease/exonuclease/phosphatase family protein [Prolixibacteraceae bacterium]|nr:endonuclease/exonuclease/phosphatase family protein [Prolixibacteraceae bacterium]
MYMKRIVFVCLLACVFGFSSFVNAQSVITIASYNLRLDIASDGINAWTNRKAMVKSLIQFHEFEIVGTQEGFHHQLKELLDLPGFDYSGAGRDDGKKAGEHSAIFYNTKRFNLLDNGDFWLSETPDVPSMGWDANYKRICSWVQLNDTYNNDVFYVFNVHFDHQAKIAREQSAILLLQKIEEIAGDAPVICMGDFNSVPETIQIQNIKESFLDAYDVTELPPYGPVGTFNRFKMDAPLKDRIDYIFVSAHFKVEKYGVLTDSFKQRYPSDHMPVVVRLRMK